MRPWLLLLVSLLVSDRCPPGDGDRVADYYGWSLCRKLLQMTPPGREVFQPEHRGMRRNCVCVAARHRWTSPFFYGANLEDGCSLFQREFTGIIRRNHIPALVVSLLHESGIRAPVFLLRSDSLPAPHVIRETSHLAADIIKDHPDSWTLHHRAAASGRNFQAFLLEKSKSWAPGTIFQPQKMLTKRYDAAATVIISRCFKEIRRGMNIEKISKGQIARLEKRQKEGRRLRSMGVKVVVKYDGQAAVRQRDVFKAATLRSDISQLEIQRRVIKKNEHLNLQERAQRQHPLKAASSVYNDDRAERLLVSRENTGSINSPRYEIEATRGDNREDFNGRKITKQAEIRRPRRSHTNRKQKRLAYILRAPHKTDNNDVDTKQVLTEGVLILFLPGTERDAQTKSSSGTKLGWKTVNIPIKERDDTPPMIKAIKESFIIEPGSLKGCLFSLEMYVLDRIERTDIKPAESTTKVSTEGRVNATKTDNSTRENMGINHTKPEGNVPSEEPVVPSPPSIKTAKTERTVETTPVNMEIKETTSSPEVFSRTETPSPESETDAEPGFIKSITGINIHATTERSFSGLRMRQDIPADKTKLHEVRAVTNRPGSVRKENDPTVDSFTVGKTLRIIHKEATDTLGKTTDANVPLCRGLIHRTEAGWKHCRERSAGMGTKMSPSEDAFKDTEARWERERMSVRDPKDNVISDDEYDHFYYFDGVLKRVRSNLYPGQKTA